MLFQKGARHVHVASDGAQALKILSDPSKQVDALSLDLNMPNMDGVTLLSRAAETNYRGAIYLVSGETSEIVQSAGQLARLLGLDYRGAFSKPIDFEKVVDQLITAKVTREPRDGSAPIDYDAVAQGLRENRLKAYYQPKICTRSGKIVSAEALARIAREDGSLLDVGETIRIAEENGLIRDLTWQVAKCVIREFPAIRAQIPNEFTISFNISSDLLVDTEFCEQLADFVREQNSDPSNFVLELTESKIPNDVSVALAGLTRLRLLGFGLSIDDFGTGFSNMESLRIYPFTELKVDQQFIMNAKNDAFASACVDASVRLAKQLGLKLVAEGIETEFEATLAKAHKIDEMQGYLFSRPVPSADFVKFVGQHYRNVAEDDAPVRRKVG